jgi:hypothetical protein
MNIYLQILIGVLSFIGLVFIVVMGIALIQKLLDDGEIRAKGYNLLRDRKDN